MIMIMIKKSHINKSLLIATDLCQLQYQFFLITYLEFMVKNVKNVWKEKTLGWIVNLLGLKMAHWIISVTNVKNHGSIKNFPTLYKFCNGDLNKFFLLLRKGIYPYEYIDSWERFDENTIPPKEASYSELNLENITDKDYEHVKKVWEAFEIKNLGEYHDLYVQCDTFLLADVFENFRNKCIEIYGLDPAHFLSAPGLAW